MRTVLALCALLLIATDPVTAQSPDSLVGRDARIWAVGAPRPVSGIITHANASYIRLSTGATVCGSAGCSKSFTSPWDDIDRIQVNRHSRGGRLLRAVAIGGGAAAIMTLGVRKCGRGRQTDGERQSCWQKVVGLTIATGGVGLLVSRPAWDDITIEGRQ